MSVILLSEHKIFKERRKHYRRIKQGLLCRILGLHTRKIRAFTMETLGAQRTWKDVFRVLKAPNYQHRLLLFIAKLSLSMEEERKTLFKKKRLKYFIFTKLALHSILEKKLWMKKKDEQHYISFFSVSVMRHHGQGNL